MSAIIRIKEEEFQDNNFNLRLSFFYDGNEDTISISLENPSKPKRDALFESYFEKYLEAPYDDVPFQDIRKEIQDYGENLFKILFMNLNTNFLYLNIVQNTSLSELIIEVVGNSSSFQSIYWETLKNPEQAHPLFLEGVIFRRKNINSKKIKAEVNPSPTINLLIVTARPSQENDVAYRTIQRPLIELIQQSKLKVNPHILRPGTYEAFLKHLDEVGSKHYHIIHFDMHGSLLNYENYQNRLTKHKSNKHLFGDYYGFTELEPYRNKKAFLFFESDKKDRTIPIEAEQLATILENKQIPVVILNACQSAKQDIESEQEATLGRVLIEKGIQVVLAMRYSISVTASKIIMKSLYEKLYQRVPLEKAIGLARKELYRVKNRQATFNRKINLEDWFLPIVYQNREAKFNLIDFTSKQEKEFIEEQTIPVSLNQHLPYGFFGRDLDILKIEKALIQKSKKNILLLQGMGGSGKTTLLKYLGKWWLQTGFTKRVFYFSYGKKPYTKRDILIAIAYSIYNEVGLTEWRLKENSVQENNIINALNTNQYVLILDNTESITGVQLSIKNTLAPKQQQDLYYFLQSLKGGKSKIILGSRSDEEWLRKGTFGRNKIVLRGLDYEAATNYAATILEDLEIDESDIFKKPNFLRLMALLGGFPLAIKSIIPNLQYKLPKQILTELNDGLTNLETGNIEEKTESIIRCIEYAYSNLSEEVQQMLVLLAPFTTVVDVPLFQMMYKNLSEYQEFKNINIHDDVSELVDEAIKNGLLQYPFKKQGLPIIQFQPLFSYFLKQKLKEQEEEVQFAANTLFMAYSIQRAKTLNQMIEYVGNEKEDKEIIHSFIGLEYANIINLIEIEFKIQGSVIAFLSPLMAYLNQNQAYQDKIQLLSWVQVHLLKYSKEKLNGELGVELIEIMSNHGLALFQNREFDKALIQYQVTLTVLNGRYNLEERDKIEKRVLGFMADIFLKIGLIHQTKIEYSLAREHLEVALNTYTLINQPIEQAITHQNLGLLYQEQGGWLDAHEEFEKALNIYESENDEYRKAQMYHNLGNISFKLRFYSSAEERYFKAKETYERLGNTTDLANIYMSIGNVKSKIRDLESTKDYYYQALSIYETIGNEEAQASIYHNLVDTYMTFEDFDLAEKYAIKAISIYESKGKYYDAAKSYHGLGLIALKIQDYEKAKVNYEKALIYFLQYKETHNFMDILGQIQEIKDNEFTQELLKMTKDAYKDDKQTLFSIAVYEELLLKN